LQRLGHSNLPSWPNPSAGDSAVASPVNAQPRNKFLLLIGQFANDVNMFPPEEEFLQERFPKTRREFPIRAQPICKNRMSILGLQAWLLPIIYAL
jgi:hypothetical protein